MTMRTANIILGGVLLAFATWIIWNAQGFRDPRTGQVPIVLGAILGIAGLVLVLLNGIPKTGRPMEGEKPFDGVPWPKLGLTAAFLAAYGIGTRAIGFYESAFLFMLLTSFVLTGDKSRLARSVLFSGIFALLGTIVLYTAFDIVLRIPTRAGILI